MSAPMGQKSEIKQTDQDGAIGLPLITGVEETQNGNNLYLQ